MAEVIDGKAHAEQRKVRIRQRVQALKDSGVEPCLVAVSVGEDPAWGVYERGQRRGCESVGITYRADHLDTQVTQEDLAEHIERLNTDDSVHGIIMQSPLPGALDTFALQTRISPGKDVEAVNPANLGLVLQGGPRMAPCTARAAVELAAESMGDLKGVEAVVVGASVIVGRPVATLLLDRGATVRVCHIDTKDLKAHSSEADLLIVAVGKAGLITPDLVKPGATVIDVGINRIKGPDGKGKTVGDVDPAVGDVARALTPVPGGVGPVTATILLEATVEAAENHKGNQVNLPPSVVARLLGDAGVDMTPAAASRVATLLSQHLVPIPGETFRTAFERHLGKKALLLDGATGTEMLERGVNPKELDAANIERPDEILALHRRYVDAGAQALTTNTFCCNRFTQGGARRACEIAEAGVRLARRAGTEGQFILGCMGPLGPIIGVDIERDEAVNAVAEVAQVMADGGIDAFLLETIPSTGEALVMMEGIRQVSSLPVLVNRTLVRPDEPEIAEFCAKLSQAGAAAVGFNCGAGPRRYQRSLEYLLKHSNIPVMAIPNAGDPSYDGENLSYHLSPIYFADQVDRFLRNGVAVVGGCCGVRPDHIAAAAALCRDREVTHFEGPAVTLDGEIVEEDAPESLDRGPFLSALHDGSFPILGMVPGHLSQHEGRVALTALAKAGAAAVGLLAGWPGSEAPGPEAKVSARLRHLADATGKPAVLELPAFCISIATAQAALLNAHLLGIDVVLVDTGVFAGLSGQLDRRTTAQRLLELIGNLNRGYDARGVRLDEPTSFTVGVRLGPENFKDAEAFADAGAAFATMAPVYEPKVFRRFMAAYDGALPLLAEVLVLPDAATAEALDNEIPQVRIPTRIRERLENDPDADAHGVLRFVRAWRDHLAGLVLMVPDIRTEKAELILSEVGSIEANI